MSDASLFSANEDIRSYTADYQISKRRAPKDGMLELPNLTSHISMILKWWPETGSNRRRRPFQGCLAMQLSRLESAEMIDTTSLIAYPLWAALGRFGLLSTVQWSRIGRVSLVTSRQYQLSVAHIHLRGVGSKILTSSHLI
jgi:hypothetical protein